MPSDMNPAKNVFTYWIGDKPSLVQILHELMTLHSKNGANYSLHMLNRESFLRDYSDVPECFDRLCPAHQADVVRVWALSRHGGIWLDSDTLVMGSLSCLFDDISSGKDGFFMTENNECLFNGVFGSKRNTPLMLEWKGFIKNHLAQHQENIDWTAIGNMFLTSTYENKKELFDDYVVYDGLSTMYPVNWDQCVDSFLKSPYWTYRHLIRAS